MFSSILFSGFAECSGAETDLAAFALLLVIPPTALLQSGEGSAGVGRSIADKLALPVLVVCCLKYP